MKRSTKGFGTVEIVVVVATISVVGIAGWQLKSRGTKSKQTSQTQSTSPSTYEKIGENEVKISGSVTSEYDERPMDGDAGYIIDAKYRVTTNVAGDLSKEQLEKLIFGTVETVKIGDKVEVYARIVSGNNLTLEGKTDYYIKKL